MPVTAHASTLHPVHLIVSWGDSMKPFLETGAATEKPAMIFLRGQEKVALKVASDR